jgi:hypothetical protein
MEASTLLLLILMAIAAFMGYDYYKNKDGPATCLNYRFWAKKAPAVVAPAAPVAAPSNGVAKTAGAIGISTYGPPNLSNAQYKRRAQRLSARD